MEKKKRKKESNTFMTLIGILLQLVKHKMDTKSGINDIYSISSTTYLYLHLFIAKVQISSFLTIEVLKKKKKTLSTAAYILVILSPQQL